MRCSSCNSENLADAIFCDGCGAQLEAQCPSCGEPNRPAAKFCRNCGGRLGAAGDEPTEHARPSQAAELADRRLASTRFSEGERKRVTVLLADIRGSTSLIEKLDPEEVRQHFDPVLRIMMDAVHRYGGTVNQVLGDGVMALFGAPLAYQDHALRACYAALAMQAEMRRLAERAEAEKRGAIRIGVGINSGEVVVRSLTNDLNIDYSALGDTTHLAARMEKHAPAGAIMLTAATLREVEGYVEVKSVGALQVKGFSNAIDAFELTGATAARNRLQAAAQQGLSRFVGRAAEINLMRQTLTLSAVGRGQVLAVVGEAGMGKSRLVQQFRDDEVTAEWRVLEAPSVSYGKATLYLPLISLLRDYFSLAQSDRPDSVRRKVAAQALQLSPALSDAIAPILSLLDALPDGQGDGVELPLRAEIARFTALEPQERRRRTFSALTRLFLCESQKQPLLLIFEDLHWIDSETHEFLDALVEQLEQGRIFLLVNYRPGFSHSWADRQDYTRLRLNPLAPTGAHELLDSLLGGDGEMASLKTILIKRTEGNPFFLEESVRSLAEAGVLIGARGNYRAAVRIESVRIPNKVQTVLAERIDRLGRAEKQLLQIAAVIGVVVPLRLLRAVAGLAEEELHALLANLQGAEFIFERNRFPELEYRFTHALSNEVAYGALVRERRVALHGQVFNALETLSAEKIYHDDETMAHHAYQGELWDQAVVYLGQSGAKALACCASREAVSFLERGLQALQHLPDGRQKLESGIDLRLQLRNALFLIGDSEKLHGYLLEAESLAESLGDHRRSGRVLNFLCSYAGIAGDPEAAVEYGKRVLALPRHDDNAVMVVAHYYLGAAYNKMGSYGDAIDVLRRGMQRIGAQSKHERFGTAAVLSVICRSHLVQCLAATGDFADGIVYGDQSIHIAEEVEHPVSLVYAHCSLGVLYLLQGQLEKAIGALEQSLELCHTANVPVYLPFVASRLGAAYTASGRVAEGLNYLQQGVDDSANVGRVGFLALSMTWLAEGYLCASRFTDASACAEKALDLSRTHKERGHEAMALKLLGDIAWQRACDNKSSHKNNNASGASENFYRQAAALAASLGMAPLRAHCHGALGELYAASAAPEKARRELAAALELYRAMDMRFWLPRYETSLARCA
jgi:class 3 adenylate cyclase/tetratricopeptide (TPR) repeat protein